MNRDNNLRKNILRRVSGASNGPESRKGLVCPRPVKPVDDGESSERDEPVDDGKALRDEQVDDGGTSERDELVDDGAALRETSRWMMGKL